MLVLPKGVRHIPGHLDRAAQVALVDEIRTIVEAAPPSNPVPVTGDLVEALLRAAYEGEDPHG